MTERSLFWDGTSVGDATVAPYDAATEYAQTVNAFFRGNSGAVAFGIANSLACTVSGANIRVGTGQGFVYGTWYENTANVDVAIPTPGGATRNDLIVLRKSWAAQTVRIARVAGVEGGGIPGAAATVGTTYELILAVVSVTTAGVITIAIDLRASADILPFVPATVPALNAFGAGSPGTVRSINFLDHVHGYGTPAAPVAQLFNDVAAAGSGARPAREDHVHGMPKVFRLVKATDQTFSGGADDNTLQFAVLNGETYLFEAVIHYVTDDITVGINVPTGTGRWSAIHPDGTTPTTVAMTSSASVSSTIAVGGGDATPRSMHIRGSFTAGANGTFKIQYNSGASITVQAFSHLLAFKI